MYEFQHPTPVAVALQSRTGVVQLYAESRDDIQVTVEPMDGKESSREAADHTRVQLEGDTLVVEVPNADGWTLRRWPKLAITVRVPTGSSLTGKSAAADVTASGSWSAVKLDVASADVEIHEVTGDARLDAASGELTVGRVGGSLSIESASGDLRVGDVNGDVSAKSASGDVRLGAVDGRLRASTASGDVEVTRLSQGRSEVKTASGDVQVGIAAGASVWLDLSTASGRTTSGLTPQHGAAPAAEGSMLELRVRTASGDIDIQRSARERRAA